ncbi:CheR family methyltransferase [Clostridium felsineum]|uniref:CheR family methyltransferase n=1 Tax=Clostridium felsineum TaxID=36839 RepID=UPI00098C7598|nr:protein-glutamate O-methyltransferase CheR [Clostridium felsineum]URZ18447.1 Chemotaxis protein methyltransferase Cher2 [Clostridium felsineum DSM 794]
MDTINENQFKEIYDYIRNNFGVSLKRDDRRILTNKYNKFLEAIGVDNFKEAYTKVANDTTGEYKRIIADIITVNYTFFMRESQHFSYFKNEVLPYLKDVVKDKDLRIWCAACSSGEEAYTLAMIIEEFFINENLFWDKKILATDISSKVLEKAINGIYTLKDIEALPINWRFNYFNKISENDFAIRKEIKDNVIYRRFNLMEEKFPFKKKFQVIFCRNAMMYFDSVTQKKVLKKFYDNTEKGGYLFVGHSEAINVEGIGYKCVKPAVYRK